MKKVHLLKVSWVHHWLGTYCGRTADNVELLTSRDDIVSCKACKRAVGLK